MTIHILQMLKKDNLQEQYKHTAAFYLNYPPEKLKKYELKIYGVPTKDRKKVWEGFGFDMSDVEKKYKKMIIERNNHAKEKGFSSRIEMYLDRFKIPKKDYDFFLKNVEKLILKINKNLPEKNLPDWFYTEFNNPCFLCRISKYPFKNVEEVKDYMYKSFKEIENVKKAIKIQFGDWSEMDYDKNKNIFTITLEKNENIRHKISDLIHEFSHIIFERKSIKKDIDPDKLGKYVRERESTRIELEIAKKLSMEYYWANNAQFLNTIHNILFEIEITNNPNQDLSKLYAKLFNRCFIDAKQKVNRSYILKQQMVKNNFFNLSHAVSISKILLK